MSFQPLNADKPVKIPADSPITRVVVEIVEKYIEEDPIYITLNIWGCFESLGNIDYY